jgi:hypothetical protein
MQQLGHLTRSGVVVATTVIDECSSHGIGLIELGHVLSATPPEFLEGRRKVSRFRDELTGEAEGVGVVAHFERFQFWPSRQVPGHHRHSPQMGLNAEFIDLSPAVESPRQGQGVSCRFRGVLRDIGRDPQVTPVVDQISDLDLTAPTNGSTSKTDQFDF